MEAFSEKEPLLQKDSEGKLNIAGELSFSGSALVLICTAVGAGIVAVPRAFSFSGWFAGIFALMVSGALSSLSLSCLFKCAEVERRSSTYQTLVQQYLPAGLSLFVDMSAAALLLGAIGTMLLLAMHVWQSVELAVGVAPFSPSHMPWALLISEILLCLPRNFSELQWVSIVNLCAVASVVLIICSESAQIVSKGVLPVAGFSVKVPMPGLFATTSLSGLLAALPITLYGFFCQFQAPALYSELQPSNRCKTSLISGAASAFCFIVYSCVGLLGYAAFGVNTDSDILAQLTKLSPTNHWLCLGQVLFGCVLLLSTPLVLAPLRSMLLRSIAKDSGTIAETHDPSLGAHIAATATILGSAMMIALHVPGVDFIMGILGSTCVVFLALIVPGMLTLNCCGNDWKMRGWILVVAGLICTPLTFGAFMAQHLGYLPR